MSNQTFYDFSVPLADGTSLSTATLKGNVVLIVNTATMCGYANQFEDLEYLHKTYKDQGLVVIGMPSNQFKQEPTSDDDMIGICRQNFGVTFTLSQTVAVNGSNAHPLMQYVKKQTRGLLGSSIKWNFTKFLVDRDGSVIKRYSPTVNPRAIEADIKRCIESKSGNES